MRDILSSMIEEVGAMLSGKFVAYHKTAFAVVFVVATIFALVFTHASIFEGKIGVVDLDASDYSRELIELVNASPYIEVHEVYHSPVPVATLVAHDRLLGVLYIPKGLEEGVKRGSRTVTLGYFADATNESQNAEVLEELNEYIPELGAEFGAVRVARLGLGANEIEATLAPMALKTRQLFNPTKTFTNATSIAFVYFFSSLFYTLTVLMIPGRLRITGMWSRVVMRRSAWALMARIAPYAFFYTTAIICMSALLSTFGQLEFHGNIFAYVPSIFMTGMSFGLLGFIIAWRTKNPGEGAGMMSYIVPPGFVIGGATMAVGYALPWAYVASYIFPLTWQFRFWRDFGMRGASPGSMLPTYGAYILYMTVLALVIWILFEREQRRFLRDEARDAELDEAHLRETERSKAWAEQPAR